MRAILTYHSIDESGSVISVGRETFAAQAAWLASGRVRVTTVDELLALPPDADAVALTFDDGFQNFADTAVPVLERHGLRATVFVVADRVGETNAWPGDVPRMPLMDWPTLSDLAARGFSVGAHTRTHPSLARLTGATLADEIAGSAELIGERCGVQPRGFAYPYGDVSNEAATVVERTFAWGCTTRFAVLSGGEPTSLLPRLDMYYFREHGQLESWGTMRFNAYLALRAGTRAVKQRWLSAREAR